MAVHRIDKRQLGGLGSILQLVKGILPDTQSTPTSAPTAAGIITGAVPTGAGTTATTDSACADAITKIDNALQFSENLMQADGGKPTLKDIQAVLKTLEDSLDDDCKINKHGIRDSLMQGGERFGGERNGKTMGSTSATDHKTHQGQAQNGDQNEQTTDEVKRQSTPNKSNQLVGRRAECSECERALYNIVIELQAVFSIGQVPDSTITSGINQSGVVTTNGTMVS